MVQIYNVSSANINVRTVRTNQLYSFCNNYLHYRKAQDIGLGPITRTEMTYGTFAQMPDENNQQEGANVAGENDGYLVPK